jgi:hypothetical protein
LPLPKQQVHSQNQTNLKISSYYVASPSFSEFRVLKPKKCVRSKSLTELSELTKLRELKKQREIKFQCRLKYTVIENTVNCYDKKKSTKALNILRRSMQKKRNEEYTKAAFIVMGSSLSLFFLHLPMIWSKVYNIIYQKQFEEFKSDSGVNLHFSNDTDFSCRHHKNCLTRNGIL